MRGVYIYAGLMYLAGHPYFVGLQAHPEFCTRPLDPSPPFLGFVAAACGSTVLEEVTAFQEQNFKPPHPQGAMVSEAELVKLSKGGLPTQPGHESPPLVNGTSH